LPRVRGGPCARRDHAQRHENGDKPGEWPLDNLRHVFLLDARFDRIKKIDSLSRRKRMYFPANPVIFKCEASRYSRLADFPFQVPYPGSYSGESWMVYWRP
jgi:hypothetical protein